MTICFICWFIAVFNFRTDAPVDFVSLKEKNALDIYLLRHVVYDSTSVASEDDGEALTTVAESAATSAMIVSSVVGGRRTLSLVEKAEKSQRRPETEVDREVAHFQLKTIAIVMSRFAFANCLKQSLNRCRCGLRHVLKKHLLWFIFFSS